MSDELWIEIPNWDRFQHYRDRNPPWVKIYTQLQHDETWLSLTGHQRGVLVSLWLEYASSDRQLRANTASLTRRLGLRVSSAQLEALNHAGFIKLVASRPLAIRARTRETEAEAEKSKAKQSTEASYEGDLETLGKELEQWIKPGQTSTPKR